jgi:ribonuclease III family protein
MDAVEQSCLDGADEQIFGLSAVLLLQTLCAQGQLDPSQAVLAKADLLQLSPAAFAYVGDAVYELFIRTRYLLPPKKLQIYHQQVVAEVRAESQANHLALLQPHLTDSEQEIVRRGRNAAAKGPKRVNPEIYGQATGLEALFGYLYLSDPGRLAQILSQLQLPSDI